MSVLNKEILENVLFTIKYVALFARTRGLLMVRINRNCNVYQGGHRNDIKCLHQIQFYYENILKLLLILNNVCLQSFTLEFRDKELKFV